VPSTLPFLDVPPLLLSRIGEGHRPQLEHCMDPPRRASKVSIGGAPDQLWKRIGIPLGAVRGILRFRLVFPLIADWLSALLRRKPAIPIPASPFTPPASVYGVAFWPPHFLSARVPPQLREQAGSPPIPPSSIPRVLLRGGFSPGEFLIRGFRLLLRDFLFSEQGSS